PQGVGSLLARLFASPIVGRFGARTVAAAGFVLSAIATVPFALAGADTSLWPLGAALFVRGLCLGVVMIPVMTTAYVDIDRQEMPHASAITRIVQQLGGAFGTALVAVVLTAAAAASDAAAGFGPAFWTVSVMSAGAAAGSLLLPGRTRSCRGRSARRRLPMPCGEADVDPGVLPQRLDAVLVQLLAHLRRHTGHERAGRDLRPLGDHGARGDQAAGADHRAVEHHGAHADQAVVL